MDTTAWMQMGGVAGLGAFLAGFLFSFTPVAFASIPVVLAYVTRARAFREAISYGLAFAAGLILTHVVLGIGAALGGAWAQSLLSRQWGVILGPVLILLGLLWTGWLKIPLPWLPLRGKRAATLWGAFLLGMPFTVGICPVCSPGLWIGLGVSASGLLMLAFALGRVIPLAVGAVSIGWLENLKTIERWRPGFEIAGGITLMIVGVYLLNEYYFWF
ncbi:MAG: cytochrome C biogenesis protein [Oceanospirillaceae bacterium]|nr:cytochrome C biogenesis protein [Oceanospirillaceae bacterium]MBS54969.1 cytochrome C biogenesis protein [Oceanospirillaceae bacterium]|tara:strand:+ start:56 stop:703 length:648 start_codon:yes stop_codon:yes gene_type:complete